VLRCSLGKHSQEERCRSCVYYYFLLFSLSELRKTAALRHAEIIVEGSRGKPAQGKPIDLMVPTESQRWCWVPPQSYHSLAGLAAETSCWA